MSRFKLLLSLVVMLGLALTASPVTAQEGTPSALDDPSLLEGIEAAVSRDWSVDFSAVAESPEAAEAGGLFVVSAQVMRFDSDENAGAAYQLFLDEGVASITSEGSLGGDDVDITETEIDLGDEGYQVDGISTGEDEEGAFRVTFAREGTYVYLVFAIAMDNESSNHATDILDYMINEGEPGDGEGTFNEDGGSEGGLWDVFPADDHPALAGIAQTGDEVLYPAADEGA